MATSTNPAACAGPGGFLVHRPARAHPRPLPVDALTVAAPPTVGWTASSLAGWLQYLVPLLGSGGSVAFLFAVPGPRSPWLVAAVAAAAVASVGLGLGLRLIERRAANRARRRQRARYLAHLDQVATQVEQRASAQLAVAGHLHPDLPGLWALVNRSNRLWERRRSDDDFLTVRVGRGPVPLVAPIRLDGAGGPLVEHDPELLAAAEDLILQARWLPDAPVTVPLRQQGVLSLTGPPELTRSLARSMVCQLAAFHAPDDLRILAAYPPDASPDWEWLKWLPHARDSTPDPFGGSSNRPHAETAPDPSGGPPIHLATRPAIRDRYGVLPTCLLAQTTTQLAELLDREVRLRLASPGPGTAAGVPGGRLATSGAAGVSGGAAVTGGVGVFGGAGASGRAGASGGPGVAGDGRGGGSLPHLVVVLEPGRAPGGAASSGVVLDELLEQATAVGVTVVWLAGDTSGEPSELAARIRLYDNGSATFEETAPGGRLVAGIRADTGGLAFCEAIARRLAPLRLDGRSATAPRAAPTRLLDLLDLLDPGSRTIDPEAGLRPRPRPKLLQVPVGGTPDGDPVVLDLKEAAEGGIGPHGLVVGATGSGKSELLRTVVAGLAATHPPEQLAFVLVDFKGGAAFAELAPLPQVAGMITNLQSDLSMVDRAMAALQGELARRQRLLFRSGNQPDLRAYAARREVDPRLEPLPHLLIVVDEFGELLAVRPELLDLFVAIGRVGRSLGMHLLLASQRLDEGRLHGLDGHLRFRICLRTFSAAESTAVLGVPDAYHLPPAPGTALLKVDAASPLRFTAARISTRHPPPPGGQPDPTTTGQPAGPAPHAPGSDPPGPALAGVPCPIVPFAATGPGRPLPAGSEPFAPEGSGPLTKVGPSSFTPSGPEVPLGQGFVPGAARAGFSPRSADSPARPGGPSDPGLPVPGLGQTRPGPSDLEVLVAELAGAGPPVHQVWLPPLSAALTLDELLNAVERRWLRVPVGVVDRPVQQVQEPMVLDLSGTAGHLAVVGAPRTGKSTLLCTLLAALAATHPPDEVQAYAVDLGGGLLHRLGEVPHVGAVCGSREPERVHRLVRELRCVVAERERRFRDLGVESMAGWHELRRAGLDLGGHGEVFLLIDNWGALVRELPELEADIIELAAIGLHYGVHLVLAANRWAELRPGLRDNLGGRLELRLNDPLESELGRTAAAALPELPGRGLTQSGLQFQAALPGPAAAVLDRALAGPGGVVAPPLRLLPALVGEASLPAAGPGQPPGLPFAVEEHRLEPVWLDLFAGSPHLLVLGDAECGKSSLLRLVARGLAARHRPDEVALLVVDLRRGLLDLTALPHLAGYACTTATLAQAVDRLRHRLTERLEGGIRDLPDPLAATWASPPPEPSPGPVAPLIPGQPPGVLMAPTHEGPRYVVLVDDYDLLPAATGSPLLPLLELLGQGRELGFHLVLTRSVAGAARAAFEPVFQRLRELGGSGLIMRGSPSEGPVLSGHKAADLPAGRGFLVRPRQPPTLVQVAYSPPPARAETGANLHADRRQPDRFPAGHRSSRAGWDGSPRDGSPRDGSAWDGAGTEGG